MTEQTFDHTYDVVVVGSGTGLMGAITAARAGLRTLVVEKGATFGGSTAMSGGGMWMPGNAVITRKGIPDSRERVETYLDAIVGDDAASERRAAFLAKAPEVVDQILSNTPLRLKHMPEYADYFSETTGGSAIGRSVEPEPFDLNSLGEDADRMRKGPMEAPVPMPITSSDFKWMNLMKKKPIEAFPRIALRVAQGVGGKVVLKKNMVAGGMALAAGLVAGARKAGVELWTNAPLRELVVEDGRVVGVKVNRDGFDRTIAATRGVILATGGFDHNMDLRRKHQSEALTDDWSFGNPDNTGDVIEIAERAGAALELMDQTWWFPAMPPLEKGGTPTVMLAERSLPGSLIVDSSGHRFFNESCDYMTAGRIMLGHDDGGEPHLPAWLIFDQTYRNSYVFAAGVMPGMAIPQPFYDAGVVVKADSIAELGRAIGVPGLVEGVERFNLLAGQGHDDDFQRGLSHYDRYYGDPTNTPNPNLRPLGKGPFYAAQVVPGDLGTCGGLKADEHARVLDGSGSVIEGLYAVGNCAANAFGKVYPGPGATIGQGVVFAHIAAQHIAGRG
ncbi:MAG: FAD-dependent oxidoreductase [Propioniciclava sp.]|nr:FAD-dependent oxidoreductase [Propioniciclava sp.]